MLRAQRSDTSRWWPPSTIASITPRTSYTLRAAEGTTALGSALLGSAGAAWGGVSPAFWGRWASRSRTNRAASTSFSVTNWQTPFFSCTLGPPSPAASTDSPVTSPTMPGPVRNIADSRVITTKSVRAGE